MRTLVEINQEYAQVCAEIGDLDRKIVRCRNRQHALDLEAAESKAKEEAEKAAEIKPEEPQAE